MLQPEISYVTWSSTGIRVVYSRSMVVHLSGEDMYSLAVKSGVVSLVDTEQVSMVPKAS